LNSKINEFYLELGVLTKNVTVMLLILLNHIVVYINNCSYKRQGILFKPNKAIEIKYKEQDVCVNHVFFFHWTYPRYAKLYLNHVHKTFQFDKNLTINQEYKKAISST
jgi:hypothetical protein